MIAQERENSAKVVGFKVLKLISPEHAKKLGLPAESPTFVSAIQSGKDWCTSCGVTYEPLVYQKGYLVQAHHFHKSTNGGVYYEENVVVADGYFNSWMQALISGWIAMVNPAGSEVSFSNGHVRSPQVFVEKIRAFCTDRNCMSGPKSKELGEGIAFIADEYRGELLPICSLEKHLLHVSRARYTFKTTEDGEVLFSQI